MKKTQNYSENSESESFTSDPDGRYTEPTYTLEPVSETISIKNTFSWILSFRKENLVINEQVKLLYK